MLQIVNLSCIRSHRSIFSTISLQINPGEMLLIEGPNGSGKSSLLRLIAGLASPATGTIYWQGKTIQAQQYGSHLHYVGHTNGIKPGLTVIENIQLAHHLSLATPSTNIFSVLSLLQLDQHKQLPAAHLSAGQKRRLALAKLLLIPKLIWILDEPLTALDAHTQIIFISHLENHLKKGGLCLLSSHQPLHFNTLTTHTLRLNAC